MKSDTEIADSTVLEEIDTIARKAGIPAENLFHYGPYIAKVPLKLINDHKAKKSHLILVTAITATKAGVGKTTVSIGLGMGLNHIGKKAIIALREPSLGPCFGIKGGATGGGYAQVLPPERINLHFTGDFHAITSAHNLIAAQLDNYIFQNRAEGSGLKNILWRRVMDMNDRSLRQIVTGLGGLNNGIPTEAGFDITPASEIMAILCLSKDMEDMEQRIGRIVVAHRYNGEPFTVNDLGITGPVLALLRDAIEPNLVQTTEHNPVLVHGGPFANIAHGCNSIMATRMAMRFGDVAITEAGFGADLGAEKFLDIKCRYAGIAPSACVLVATVRALKSHGGVAKADLNQPNLEAVKAGASNLIRHIDNLKNGFGLPVVVAINAFPTDTAEEQTYVEQVCAEQGVPCVLSEVFAKGGEGGKALAEKVLEIMEDRPIQYTYPLAMPLKDKINAIATKIYHADGVNYSAAASKTLAELTEMGYGNLPVCIAKTQYSFSDNAKLTGAPTGFTMEVREVRLAAGAGFVVVICGNIMTMPGLPKKPAAVGIDVDADGKITGLF